MRDSTRIESMIRDIGRLPTLPGVAIRILDTVKREVPDLKELVEIISTDPPLSAEILRMANSSYYGLSRKVASVSHAVNMLGVNAVKNLTLGFCLVRSFRNKGKNAFDYVQFWKNSLVSAVACRLIAEKNCPDAEDDAFFLGLLHNIGILTFNQIMPLQYDLVLQEMSRSSCSHESAEARVLGFDHMEMGAYLVKLWGLPENFSDAILFHHDSEIPDNVCSETSLMIRIVHLASLCADLFSLPEKGFQLAMISHRGIETGLLAEGEADVLVRGISEKTMEVFPLFEIEVPDDSADEKMLETARYELGRLGLSLLKIIDQQQRTIHDLQRRASHDALTGALNYHSFYQLLERELVRSRRYDVPLCIMLSDVDNFKQVNDVCGHLAGDKVLRAVVSCFQMELRESDSICRYGGDEFAVILPESESGHAMAVAERLRCAVESLVVDCDGVSVSVTVSTGVASIPDENDDVSPYEVFRRADSALYSAKRKGRNNCCLFGTSEQ
jgi:two-component system, cell cycle response regulator